MANAQQPEHSTIGDPGDLGPIPEDQQPGHHPDVEQDKPSGEAFLEKLHAHAAEVDVADADADEAGDEVTEPVATDESSSDLADRAAEAVGKPFEAAADLLQKVRDRLGD